MKKVAVRAGEQPGDSCRVRAGRRGPGLGASRGGGEQHPGCIQEEVAEGSRRRVREREKSKATLFFKIYFIILNVLLARAMG